MDENMALRTWQYVTETLKSPKNGPPPTGP